MLGKRDNEWHVGEASEITFVVTKECNLRCKYCYMTSKNGNERMSFETAKEAIDYFFREKKRLLKNEYIILDFIGGEPLLEIDLIDKIVDYFKYVAFKSDDDWFGKYRINISTNGILYSSEKVQRFIAKNKFNLSIGISIDGVKQKHDMQRVYPDGRGSYDDVIKNVELWIQQYPEASTKVTIGHDDLPFVKDSIIHLWNLGIKNVPANTIFEDVWDEGDPAIFEQQLRELADYIIENHLWDKYNTTLFSDMLGFKQLEDEVNKNFCGTGKAYAVDSNGNIFPCVRYISYSLDDKKEIRIGNIKDGVDLDKLRPFHILTAKLQSPHECLECPVSTGCAYCQAENYDQSNGNTNFERSLASCKMHQARVRANNYYWARLYHLHGVERVDPGKYKRSAERMLYIMMSDMAAEICANYHISDAKGVLTSKEKILDAFRIANDEFRQPYLVHQKNIVDEYLLEDKDIQRVMTEHFVKHLVPFSLENITYLKRYFNMQDIYPIFCDDVKLPDDCPAMPGCILIVHEKNIDRVYEWTRALMTRFQRINLKCEILNADSLEVYREQIELLVPVIGKLMADGKGVEVSCITDRLYLDKMADNCNAGWKNMTYGVNGEKYICPAEYYEREICNTANQSEVNMTSIEKAPTCQVCDCYQCERCVYLSKKRTLEYNIPSSIQCEKSRIERGCTVKLRNHLSSNHGFKWGEAMQEYRDPYEYLLDKWNLKE